MKLDLDTATGRYNITGYRAGAVMINGVAYAKSVIVTPRQLVTDWPPVSADVVTIEHVHAICALEPEIVLIGTGQRLTFPDAGVLGMLVTAGIGVECMDTPAACRSFAVLAAEGRAVAAALMIA
ncbi:MAG: hypothetical protein IT495_15780 [Gammaproteobacteria bacterium]|nr:hypothetical protein [Gammaproteobacteria bacterium]